MSNKVKTVLNAEELLTKIVNESKQKADYVVRTEGMRMYASQDNVLNFDLNTTPITRIFTLLIITHSVRWQRLFKFRDHTLIA